MDSLSNLTATLFNLDTTNYAVRQKLHDIAQSSLDHHCLELDSSSIPFNIQYQPGGTLILINDNTVRAASLRKTVIPWAAGLPFNLQAMEAK
jgi:hypothetical protein